MTEAELRDRLELADLIALYSRAVDRRDFALLANLYAPGATQDHGAAFAGSAADFVAWVARSMGDMDSQHFVGSTLFRIAGDTAEGEIYTVNYHIIPGAAPRSYTAAGRYLDRYVRHEGRWRFAARTRVLDWSREEPAREGATAAGAHRGRPGPDDPSFTLLPHLVAAL